MEIQKGARIRHRVKISNHTFISEGLTVEDDVFNGHSVVFINHKYPMATNTSGQLQTEADWVCIPTLVKRGASIGSNANILCGITISKNAIVGVGSALTHDVPDNAVVLSDPARFLHFTTEQAEENSHTIAVLEREA